MIIQKLMQELSKNRLWQSRAQSKQTHSNEMTQNSSYISAEKNNNEQKPMMAVLIRRQQVNMKFEGRLTKNMELVCPAINHSFVYQRNSAKNIEIIHIDSEGNLLFQLDIPKASQTHNIFPLSESLLLIFYQKGQTPYGNNSYQAIQLNLVDYSTVKISFHSFSNIRVFVHYKSKLVSFARQTIDQINSNKQDFKISYYSYPFKQSTDQPVAISQFFLSQFMDANKLKKLNKIQKIDEVSKIALYNSKVRNNTFSILVIGLKQNISIYVDKLQLQHDFYLKQNNNIDEQTIETIKQVNDNTLYLKMKIGTYAQTQNGMKSSWCGENVWLTKTDEYSLFWSTNQKKMRYFCDGEHEVQFVNNLRSIFPYRLKYMEYGHGKEFTAYCIRVPVYYLNEQSLEVVCQEPQILYNERCLSSFYCDDKWCDVQNPSYLIQCPRQYSKREYNSMVYKKIGFDSQFAKIMSVFLMAEYVPQCDQDLLRQVDCLIHPNEDYLQWKLWKPRQAYSSLHL